VSQSRPDSTPDAAPDTPDTQPARTAEKAIAKLVNLPDLTQVDMSLTAIGPDQDGPWSGFSINLTGDAKDDVSQIAESSRRRLQDSALLAYGPAVLIPPQHWMHVSETDAATLATVQSTVRTQDVKPFNGNADYASKVKMVAAHFATADQQSVTFYRIADSMLQLKKAKVVGLVKQGDVYGRLEPADVLLLRNDFDVIVIDGFAFFAKKATFERAFGFVEQLQQESQATFTAVTTNLRIQGMAELEKACTSQPQMMAKMASIKRSMDADPAYAEAMTMDRLITYIEEHPHVHVKVDGTGENRQLVFDPKPARRFQILKLLDDDFLHSMLTERDYEAGSKVPSSD
jgi:hypothetical protein